MQEANNKEKARVIITSASYNSTTQEESDKNVLNKAEKYKKNGRAVHKIERFIENGADNLKFLYPLCGVPVLSFSLINSFNSGAEKIALVGSEEVKKIYNKFMEEFKTGDRIIFVHEGNYKKLSLSNTLKRACSRIKPEKNELELFLPADLPLLTNLEDILCDSDIVKNNAVLDFNCKENLFQGNSEIMELFNKTFYHTFLNCNNKDIKVKEPNPHLLNLSYFEERNLWKIFDIFYSSRKAGGIGASSFLPLFFPFRVFSLAKLLRFFIEQRHNIKERKIDFKTLEKITELTLDTRVKLKAEHSDIGRLIDIDSYQDHEFFEVLFNYTEKIHALKTLYPHSEMLGRFRERLKNKAASLSPEYINYRREKLGFNRLYHDKKVIFDKKREETAEKSFKYLK